jgi:uncharacterized membrane protein (UPF0136 family)
MLRKISIAFLCGMGGVMLLAAIYDIIPASNSTSGDTLTEVVVPIAEKFFAVWFAIGTVSGHWLWTVSGKIRWQKQRGIAMIVVGSLVVVANVVCAIVGHYPQIPMILVLVAGVGAGRFLWTHRRKEGTS